MNIHNKKLGSKDNDVSHSYTSDVSPNIKEHKHINKERDSHNADHDDLRNGNVTDAADEYCLINERQCYTQNNYNDIAVGYTQNLHVAKLKRGQRVNGTAFLEPATFTPQSDPPNNIEKQTLKPSHQNNRLGGHNQQGQKQQKKGRYQRRKQTSFKPTSGNVTDENMRSSDNNRQEVRPSNSETEQPVQETNFFSKIEAKMTLPTDSVICTAKRDDMPQLENLGRLWDVLYCEDIADTESAITEEESRITWTSRNEDACIVGMNNHGNTCYMNAALQALFHCLPLEDFFLSCSGHVSQTIEPTKKSLSWHFHQLILAMRTSGDSSAKLRNLVRFIRQSNVLFQGFSQQVTPLTRFF